MERTGREHRGFAGAAAIGPPFTTTLAGFGEALRCAVDRRVDCSAQGREKMGNILASAWFHVAVVPVILMLVGVLAKRLGRRDGDDSPGRNDFAVGTTVLLMVLGTVLGDLRTAQAQVAELLGWLIGILFTIFLSLDHDRFRSWERDSDGLPTKKKRLIVGVVFPDILCLAVFGFYQAQKVGLI